MTTWEDSFKMLRRLLEIYAKASLVMSSDNFQFGQDMVKFAGMQVKQTGVRPARESLPSI